MANNVISNMPDISCIVNVATLTPEIMVAATAFVLLLGGVFAGNKSTNLLHALGFFVLVSLLAIMTFPALPHTRVILFSHMFVSDPFSHFVKVMIIGGAALVFLLAAGWVERAENQRFEFPVLMLFSLLGMMLMVSANNLIALYVGLELSSLALYVLASFSRDSLKSTEAGLKYFVLGALASGMLLFGASLVYGFAGTTSFEALQELFKAHHTVASSGVIVGLILIIVGL